MEDKKLKRPTVPPQCQRELWARAAGRCEFRGCNKLLYQDELTKQRSNLAIVSHIVSYSPTGPRGDPVRSKQLEIDIRNLMLTCHDHGKLVDDKVRELEYPEGHLLEFKREHEQRIRMLTEITEEAQTHILLLQASVDARDFEIDPEAAFRAILPKYSAEEQAAIIDLTGPALPTGSDGFFSFTAESITEHTRELLRRRPAGKRIKSLSIFALAPVPLLVHFGHLLGDIQHIDLYQRHRDGQDWSWKREEAATEFYEVVRPEDTEDGTREIALVLSVSASVGRAKVEAVLGENPLIYEIRAVSPGVDFLRSRKRLEVFGYEIRKLLTELRETYGHDRKVHLFAAAPTPVAIEVGRSIKNHDPPFLVYEYDKAHRCYVPAFIVNPRGS